MHPILIQFGDSFFIGTYGVAIALGLLLSINVMTWRGRATGVPTNDVWDVSTMAVLAGFVGARLVYIATNFGDFLKAPGAMIFSRDGFVFLGGLVVAIPACYLFLRKRGIETWRVADLVAIGLPLTHAFGRIGCHFAGCCFGGACRIDWLAIHLHPEMQPNGVPFTNAWLDQVERGLIAGDAPASLGVWPVQLLEAGALLLLTGGVLLWSMRKPRPTGAAFAVYLMIYAAIRFGTEFLRGDAYRGMYFDGMVSQAQLVSMGVFVGGIGLLWIRRNAAPALPPPAEPAAEGPVGTPRRRSKQVS